MKAFFSTFIVVLLAGCSSLPPSGNPPTMNNQVIASPAARISAGSGAMHTGMSSGFGY